MSIKSAYLLGALDESIGERYWNLSLFISVQKFGCCKENKTTKDAFENSCIDPMSFAAGTKENIGKKKDASRIKPCISIFLGLKTITTYFQVCSDDLELKFQNDWTQEICLPGTYCFFWIYCGSFLKGECCKIELLVYIVCRSLSVIFPLCFTQHCLWTCCHCHQQIMTRFVGGRMPATEIWIDHWAYCAFWRLASAKRDRCKTLFKYHGIATIVEWSWSCYATKIEQERITNFGSNWGWEVLTRMEKLYSKDHQRV